MYNATTIQNPMNAGSATVIIRSLFAEKSFLRSLFSLADSFVFPFSWRIFNLQIRNI